MYLQPWGAHTLYTIYIIIIVYYYAYIIQHAPKNVLSPQDREPASIIYIYVFILRIISLYRVQGSRRIPFQPRLCTVHLPTMADSRHLILYAKTVHVAQKQRWSYIYCTYHDLQDRWGGGIVRFKRMLQLLLHKYLRVFTVPRWMHKSCRFVQPRNSPTLKQQYTDSNEI